MFTKDECESMSTQRRRTAIAYFPVIISGAETTDMTGQRSRHIAARIDGERNCFAVAVVQQRGSRQRER